MALIPCPECKREVSDRAPRCPHCGIAIAGAGASAPPAALPAAATPWTIPAPGGAAAEEVVWQGRPSPRLMIPEIAGLVWAALAIPLVMAVLPAGMRAIAGLHPDLGQVVASDGDTMRLVVIGAAVAYTLFRAGKVALRYARYRTTAYRLTNQRLVVESGLFSRRLDEVDLRGVEDVGFEQPVLERLLGVGRITVVSTDRVRPRVALVGIAAPREVRELLRARAYEASQRQVFTRST